MKRLALGILAFLYAQSVSSQEQPILSDTQTLWLRGNPDAPFLEEKGMTAYNFNFNPVFAPVEAKDLEYGTKVKDKYSLFAVFRSDSEDEVTLMNLKLNGSSTKITNKGIVNETENRYSKVDTKQGIVLSYLVDRKVRGRKKSRMILENLSRPNTEEGYRNDLMELLWYDRVLGDIERRKVETYLSIKYGISLLGQVDYVDSEGHTIWDSKENAAYGSRVTGIGKDGFWGLEQKQSGNAQKDGLYLGLGEMHSSNIENTNAISDRTFLLWGDNNGTLKMEAGKKGAEHSKKMKRVWKLQRSMAAERGIPATQLVIDKAAFGLLEAEKKTGSPKKDDFVWLLIDRDGGATFDYIDAEYYMQSRDEEGKLLFDGIEWDTDKSGTDTFTFIKAPDFFVEYEVADTDCSPEEGEVAGAIIGGKAPFRIGYAAVSGDAAYEVDGRSISLQDLDAGEYAISVTDRLQQTQRDTLNVGGLKNVTVDMASEWCLGDGSEAIITPQVVNPSKEKLSFAWKKGARVLSTESQFTAFEPGDYALLVSNEQGCQKELLFRVNASEESAQRWVLYPNPAKMDEPFTIRFDLEKESDVSVGIFDFSNKLLKSEHLGKRKAFAYSEKLSTIGTFLIVVTIDGIAESAKIIIR
ncbi:T9SS type A sorting domain-containing protein [Flavobacterium soli]|uniref:hypothetical protein n=1 Tax=Flavobacterium soli TaxID=344881 RepID=UPI0012FC23CB|nr:hypothetical protein [Flavobacterium soli]